MGTEITEAILQSIDYLVSIKASQLTFDKTVTGTIVSCTNASTREYKVTYQGGYFFAYAAEGVTYSQNTSVFILVPQGNFSNVKHIIGKASLSTDSTNITYTASALSGYSMVGNNVLTAVDGKYPVGLSSYLKTDIKALYLSDEKVNELGINESDYIPTLAINNDTIAKYIKASAGIVLKADFRTNLSEEHKKSNQGIYKLIVTLVFQDSADHSQLIYKTYILDSSMMSGQPFNFVNFSNQYSLFNIENNNFVRVDSILFESLGFEDTSIEKDYNDIFINNIQLYGVKENIAVNGDYSLIFNSPEGLVLSSLNESDTLNFSVQLLYQKKTPLTTKVKYYWFKEDSQVSAESTNYNVYGGQGWKLLSDFTSSYLTVNGKQNLSKENKYKCVVVYNSDIQIKEEFTVYNAAAEFDLSLVSDRGTEFAFDQGIPTISCKISKLGKVETDLSPYLFYWSTTDENNSTTVLSESVEDLQKQIDAEKAKTTPSAIALMELTSKINQFKDITFKDNTLKIPISQITNSLTIKCSVYAGTSFIGTCAIILKNALSISVSAYSINIENSNQIFQYDESGISPASSKQSDPVEVLALTAHLIDNTSNTEVESNKYSIKWKFPIGSNTLIKTPSDSLIAIEGDSNFELYNGSTFPLSIVDTYNYNAINNQIEAQITYLDENFSQSTNFTFFKAGENGTNGTEITSKISYNDYSVNYLDSNNVNQVIHPLLAFESKPNGEISKWQNGILNGNNPFSLELYQGNTQLSVGTPTWYVNNSKYFSIVNNSIKYVVNENNNLLTNMQLKGFISYSYTDSSGESQHHQYYAYCGLPIIQYSQSGYKVVIDKNKTIKNVLYDSDGHNPKYNSNQGISFKVLQSVDNQYVDISNNNTYFYTALGGDGDSDYPDFSLLVDNKSRPSYTSNVNFISILPKDIITGQYQNNRVRVIIKNNDVTIATLYVPIRFYLNVYGLQSLNGWDGNTVDVNNDGYILAPQIGAGSKNSNNQFTGIVMGTAKNSTTTKTGLLGYANGEQSIFLDAETGAATFGLSSDGNGRINLVPNGTSDISGWGMNQNSLYSVTNKTSDLTTDILISNLEKKDFPIKGEYDKVYHDQTTDKYYIFNSFTVKDYFDSGYSESLKSNIQTYNSAKGDLKTLYFDSANKRYHMWININNNYIDCSIGYYAYQDGSTSPSINQDYSDKDKSLLPTVNNTNKLYHVGSIYYVWINYTISGYYEIDYHDGIYRGSIGEYVAGSEGRIPYELSGIILGSNPSFINIKGKRFTNLTDTTELNNGDSIEIEIDPMSNTPFTIYRDYFDVSLDENNNVTGKTWKREETAGIDNVGEFYANALKNSETNLRLGAIPAFGYSLNESPYYGASFGIKSPGTTSTFSNYYPLTKFFIKAYNEGSNKKSNVTSSELANNDINISFSNDTSNEYQRALNIYANGFNLYSKTDSKNTQTSDSKLNLNNKLSYFGNTNGYLSLVPSAESRLSTNNLLKVINENYINAATSSTKFSSSNYYNDVTNTLSETAREFLWDASGKAKYYSDNGTFYIYLDGSYQRVIPQENAPSTTLTTNSKLLVNLLKTYDTTAARDADSKSRKYISYVNNTSKYYYYINKNYEEIDIEDIPNKITNPSFVGDGYDGNIYYFGDNQYWILGYNSDVNSDETIYVYNSTTTDDSNNNVTMLDYVDMQKLNSRDDKQGYVPNDTDLHTIYCVNKYYVYENNAYKSITEEVAITDYANKSYKNYAELEASGNKNIHSFYYLTDSKVYYIWTTAGYKQINKDQVLSTIAVEYDSEKIGKSGYIYYTNEEIDFWVYPTTASDLTLVTTSSSQNINNLTIGYASQRNYYIYTSGEGFTKADIPELIDAETNQKFNSRMVKDSYTVGDSENYIKVTGSAGNKQIGLISAGSINLNANNGNVSLISKNNEGGISLKTYYDANSTNGACDLTMTPGQTGRYGQIFLRCTAGSVQIHKINQTDTAVEIQPAILTKNINATGDINIEGKNIVVGDIQSVNGWIYTNVLAMGKYNDRETYDRQWFIDTRSNADYGVKHSNAAYSLADEAYSLADEANNKTVDLQPLWDAINEKLSVDDFNEFKRELREKAFGDFSGDGGAQSLANRLTELW